MSQASETYDNVYTESLFSRYKTELLEGRTFANVEEAWLENFDYIESYYTGQRKHLGLAT